MDNIDLRHLRYFIAVAEERHFTRAAQRLGIRQPPLSMQIKQLEGALESRLFRRLPRGVELTEAGAGFLDDAREVLARLDAARVEARRRSAGQLGRLRIGFAGATYLVPAVTQTMLAYRTQFPEVALLPEQSNTPALIEGLLTGRLDAAFIRPPIVVDERLSEQPVGEEPMIVALPTSHRLAKRKTIDLADIDGDTVILFPREIGPGLYDTVVTALREANVTLSLWQSAPQISSIIPLVAAGFGVSVVPKSLGNLRMDGVVFRSVRGAAPIAKVSLAYRSHEASPLVDSLRRLLHQARTRRG